VFVLSRLAVIALVPTEPVSDFRSYYSLAGLMAEGEPLPSPEQSLLFFSWGYPLALAPWFALLGKSVLLAQLLNVAAGAVAVLLLYPLARHVGGPGVGRCAALLFVFWPAQLFLTPVLASEHLSLVLSLAYLLCVIAVINGSRKAGAAVLAGVCVGLGCAVRPALGITVPIGLMLIGFGTGARWRRLVFMGLLLAGFAGAQGGYRGLLAKVYQRTPPTVAWWNLLAGTNQEKRGMWNEEDADKFFAFPTLEESNRFARREIYRRVTSDPIGNLNLIRRKLKLLWGDNYYGVYWSTRKLGESQTSAWLSPHLGRLFAWSQVCHLAALALCAFGVLRFARHPHGYAATLLLMLILSGTALHAVFEAQSRYSYVFSIGMLVFAACGAAGFPGHGWREGARQSQDAPVPTQPGGA
jgi:hypothetical protein